AHSSEGQRVAGLAVDAVNGARLEGNSVSDAELTTGHDYAGGIAATADTNTVISGNRVDASLTSARYPAGVAGYARKSVEITKNLVQAEIATTGPGAFGGMVVAYAGNANAQLDPVTRIAENVILSGSVAFTSGGDEVEMGRVVARPREAGFLIENNLVYDAVLLNGQAPEGPGELNKNGTATSADDLAAQATYESLGWDFSNAWRWDSVLGHPIPASFEPLVEGPIAGITGDGSESAPFEIRTAENLDAVAAAING